MVTNKKETTTHKLLSSLLELGVATTIDLAWAISVPKPVSHKRFRYLINNPEKTIGKKIAKEWKCERDEYRRYHALLRKLESQGLVEVDGDGKNKSWAITTTGALVLKRLQKEAVSLETLATNGGITIVSYDIPETMRRERSKLREILKLMDFRKAHQSVWLGNKKITADFLKLLRERKIIEYVHIFEVSRTGTLKKIEET